jgi:hypothetical protein
MSIHETTMGHGATELGTAAGLLQQHKDPIIVRYAASHQI